VSLNSSIKCLNVVLFINTRSVFFLVFQLALLSLSSSSVNVYFAVSFTLVLSFVQYLLLFS
jgi:hypothetical protein